MNGYKVDKMNEYKVDKQLDKTQEVLCEEVATYQRCTSISTNKSFSRQNSS